MPMTRFRFTQARSTARGLWKSFRRRTRRAVQRFVEWSAESGDGDAPATQPNVVIASPPESRNGAASALQRPHNKALKYGDTLDEQIVRRLELLGPGPAAFYRDACRVMQGEVSTETGSHLVGHMLREIEGAVRDVLLPRDHPRLPKDGTHAAEVRIILGSLDIAESDSVASAWLRFTKPGHGLARLAHRDSLGVPRPIDEVFRETWSIMRIVLDEVLGRFEDRYIAYHDTLEALLAIEEPTANDIKNFFTHVPNNAAARGEFFRRLEYPGWLSPLHERGAFARPPGAVHEDEGTTRFPPWPEAAYLLRMAGIESAQDLVARIVGGVPATDNLFVISDLARILVALPAKQAAGLVPLAKDWLTSTRVIGLGGSLRDLVVRLATGGFASEASDLLCALLSLRSPEGKLPSPFELKPRLDHWEYEQLRRTSIAPVVRFGGEAAVLALADVLAAALTLLSEDAEQRLTRGWRPTIEGHTRHLDTALNELVSCVRDAAALLITNDAETMPRLLTNFDGRASPLFPRLSLYLLRRFLVGNEALALRYLLDRAAFNSYDSQNEYWALAETALPKMPSALKQVLAWIKEGPPEREVDDPQRRADLWRLKRLTAIRAALPPEIEQRRARLEAQYGEVTLTPSGIAWRRGGSSKSPKTVDELAAMSLDDIIQLLVGWGPEVGDFGSPRSDLAQALAAAVAREPARFAARLGEFRVVHSRYASGLLQGFQTALRDGSAVDWDAVLLFCEWVVAQPRSRGRLDSDSERDSRDAQEWGWARRLAAGLIRDGVETTTTPIPTALRHRVWRVLEEISNDPDPTPRRDEDRSDPYSRMINSTRGEAMQSVLAYAQWLARHATEATPPRPFTFDDAPEVRRILDAHLDSEREPTLAIRSFYGRYFPELMLLDRDWAVSAVPRIFGNNPRHRAAAWETYLTWQHAYSDVWPPLRTEYDRALNEIRATPVLQHQTDPRERLAHHLARMAWFGVLALDETNGILDRFFRSAPNEFRAAAVEWLGRTLRSAKAPPPELLSRVKSLWEILISRAQNEDHWMQEFGWWFASDHLEVEWRLTQLKRLESIGG